MQTRQKELEARKTVVPIPWRPSWKEAANGEELAAAEGQAFLSWRRGLAKMEEEDGLILTPYEKNLEFWRQLWRCVERSDVLVQILDARDPEFYRCKDLERYIAQFPEKRHLLLLNKADFLSTADREAWAEHLQQLGVELIFFSALRELQRQGAAPAEASESEGEEALPPHGPLELTADVADCAQLISELQSRMGEGQRVVGFVGYPNVGKSSVINALFGSKKVSMSRTPGKTKHLQTLELADLTLCDCPGLVFPSLVATRAHLVINGTVPLDELKDFIDPVRLVVQKIGPEPILKKYGVSAAEVKDGAIRRGVGEASDEMAHQVGGHFVALFAPRCYVAWQHIAITSCVWASRMRPGQPDAFYATIAPGSCSIASCQKVQVRTCRSSGFRASLTPTSAIWMSS